MHEAASSQLDQCIVGKWDARSIRLRAHNLKSRGPVKRQKAVVTTPCFLGGSGVPFDFWERYRSYPSVSFVQLPFRSTRNFYQVMPISEILFGQGVFPADLSDIADPSSFWLRWSVLCVGLRRCECTAVALQL